MFEICFFPIFSKTPSHVFYLKFNIVFSTKTPDFIFHNLMNPKVDLKTIYKEWLIKIASSMHFIVWIHHHNFAYFKNIKDQGKIKYIKLMFTQIILMFNWNLHIIRTCFWNFAWFSLSPCLKLDLLIVLALERF